MPATRPLDDKKIVKSKAPVEVSLPTKSPVVRRYPTIPGTKAQSDSIARAAVLQEHEVSLDVVAPEQGVHPEVELPYYAKVEQYPDYLAGLEEPEPHVVDFVEPSTPGTREASKERPVYTVTPAYTTMGALKLAQTAQMSPYEARTDVYYRLRDRQARDTVKEIHQYNVALPVSPRRRVNTAIHTNAYPRKKSLKSKPGAHYESPYSVKATARRDAAESIHGSIYGASFAERPTPRKARSPTKAY